VTGGVISLTPLDLALAAIAVIALAGMSFRLRLGLERRILIAGLRMTVQLLAVGFVLKTLFAFVHLGWVILMALFMLSMAGYEAMSRQKRRFRGPWGFATGSGAMFVSSFSVIVLTLVVLVQPDPWYTPQYAIPMLGMMLGNTMNGISISMDRLTQGVWEQRGVIEQRLLLGQERGEAVADIRRDAMRLGMIPMINGMAAAGVVSLPGMMTGQILGGSAPIDAVKYQILIMFLITASTGFGVMLALVMSSRRLFDERHRLRLDRLHGAE
jgi:putative ABC transport system permease protein